MLYAVNLVVHDSGIVIFNIDCANIYNGQTDLFSAFMTCLQQLGGEVFKSGDLKRVDWGNFRIEQYQYSDYNLVIVRDNDDEDISSLLQQMESIFIEYASDIKSAIGHSLRIQNASPLGINILDILSDSPQVVIDKNKLIPINTVITNMINHAENINLCTMLRLIGTKMKVGELLDEDIEAYIILMEAVNIEMETEKKLAKHHLKLIKDLIYSEYVRMRDVNDISWTKLYMYLYSFFEKLDKITRSEIARKYLCMAQKVIDKKTQKNELTNIAEELLRMDDTIDSYIKF